MTNPFRGLLDSHPIMINLKSGVENEFKIPVKRIIPFANDPLAIKEGEDLTFLAFLEDYRIIKVLLVGESMNEDYLAIACKEI